jgi:hypothetical protein
VVAAETHFKNYPLQSAKGIDFKLWQQCVQLIERKEHLTESGLNQILSLKSALNLGLPLKVKLAYPKLLLWKDLLIQDLSVLLIHIGYLDLPKGMVHSLYRYLLTVMGLKLPKL